MNRLSIDKRSQVIAALVEGTSVNATCRMTGVAKHTVLKLFKDMGCAAASYHDTRVRNLKVRRLHCDKIWSFVGAKMKNTSAEKIEQGWGDVWTWTAIDADTKLIVSYTLGQRGADTAQGFMQDVAARISTRIQLTTDGHRVYAEVVEGAFGADIDYAMLVKIYGASNDSPESRCSPATCIGCRTGVLAGNPDPKHFSTSLCRAPESINADGDAPFYSPDEWIQQETGEPRPHGRAVLHALQLLSSSQDTASHACDGSGPDGSCLGNRRIDRSGKCPMSIGVLRNRILRGHQQVSAIHPQFLHRLGAVFSFISPAKLFQCFKF